MKFYRCPRLLIYCLLTLLGFSEAKLGSRKLIPGTPWAPPGRKHCHDELEMKMKCKEGCKAHPNGNVVVDVSIKVKPNARNNEWSLELWNMATCSVTDPFFPLLDLPEDCIITKKKPLHLNFTIDGACFEGDVILMATAKLESYDKSCAMDCCEQYKEDEG